MWAYLLSIQFHSISAGAVLVAATRGHSYTTTQSPYTHTYTNTHTHQPPLLSTLLPRLSCFLSFSSGNVFFFFFFGPTSPSQIIQRGCGPDVRHQTPNLLKTHSHFPSSSDPDVLFFFFRPFLTFCFSRLSGGTPLLSFQPNYKSKGPQKQKQNIVWS